MMAQLETLYVLFSSWVIFSYCDKGGEDNQ